MRKKILEKHVVDQLVKDYESGMNLTQLVKKHGEQRRCIQRHLEAAGVEIKNKSQILREKFNINKDGLQELYTDRIMSIDEVADHYGTNTQVIKTALRDFGIPVRGSAEAKKMKKLADIPQLADKSWLVENYINNKMSVFAISKKFGCSDSLVKSSLDEFCIPRRPLEECYREATEEQKINAKIARNLRTRLYCALKNNSKKSSAVDDLGCSLDELRAHLESKFYKDSDTGDDMTWDNYGKWEIDHIKPMVGFNLSDEKEQKDACHYTNLQPLWRKDNRAKSGVVLGEQPEKVDMYIVSGIAGSGKSWVCDQLKDVNYISFDSIPKEQHYHYMVEFSKNGKPIIYDPFRKVKTLYNRYCHMFNMKVALIKEEPEVVLERLEGRGSKCTIEDVHKAMKKIKKVEAISDFIGTSDEVLDYLKKETNTAPEK